MIRKRMGRNILFLLNCNLIKLLYVNNGMEKIKFKFIASQARSIYHYKKLKIKVLNVMQVPTLTKFNKIVIYTQRDGKNQIQGIS